MEFCIPITSGSCNISLKRLKIHSVMVRTNNETELGIKHACERYFWLSFNVFILLSSLIGDTIILIAVLRYNAIKLHKVTVVIIQYLAISDLLQTLLKVLPQIITLVLEAWVLPALVCHVEYHATVFLGGMVTPMLTCFLTVSKLLIVKFPLHARTWTCRQSHVICVLICILALLSHLPQITASVLHGQAALYFEYAWYVCNYDYTSVTRGNWPHWYLVTTFSVGATLVFGAITLSSLLLLRIAQRTAVQQRLAIRRQGMMTVFLTVLLFYISYMPWLLVFQSQISCPPLWRAAQFVQNLNIMANFVIYALTVCSFREFLLSMIYRADFSFRLRSASPQQRNAVLLRQISRQRRSLQSSDRCQTESSAA